MSLVIRSVEARDYQQIQALHSQPSVYAGTLQLPMPSEELWKKRLSEPGDKVYNYVAEQDGKVVALSGLMLSEQVRRKHVAQIWITVHDDWQNRGIGTKLIQSVLDVADNWMNIQRIELEVYIDNTAAISLYEKAGFEKEGYHKSYAFKNGQYQDVISMARLKERI